MLQAVELFPVDVRNAGMGLSYNVGVCLFGGFAPMLFEAVGTLVSKYCCFHYLGFPFSGCPRKVSPIGLCSF